MTGLCYREQCGRTRVCIDVCAQSMDGFMGDEHKVNEQQM